MPLPLIPALFKCERCKKVHCFGCASVAGVCPFCGHEKVKLVGEIRGATVINPNF